MYEKNNIPSPNCQFNTQAVTDSLGRICGKSKVTVEISECTGKRHDNVMRDTENNVEGKAMNDLVIIKDKNVVVTDSLTVAEKFGKQHKHVIEKIENIIRDDEKDRSNFRPISYQDSYGRDQKKYTMDRKSFSVLCMSFSGKKALAWKFRFYDAFEAMEKILLQQAMQKSDPALAAQRAAGKMTRREETDTIQQFVEYATAQGSTSANMYYCNISKMQNKALFIFEQKIPNLRDLLDLNQLATVDVSAAIVSKALADGMTLNLHYKDIYKLAKNRVDAFAELRGQTFIPAPPLAKKEIQHKDVIGC